jgi:hypothetical protein
MSDTSFLPGQGPTTTPTTSLVTPDQITIQGDGTVKAPLTTSSGLYLGPSAPPTEILDVSDFENSEVTAGAALAPGNALYIDSTGKLQLALNDTITHAGVVGLAPIAFANGNPAGYWKNGPMTLTAAQWEAVTTEALSTGLVVGAQYWLSATAGKLTHTAPGSNQDVAIGVATSLVTLDVNIGQPVTGTA